MHSIRRPFFTLDVSSCHLQNSDSLCFCKVTQLVEPRLTWAASMQGDSESLCTGLQINIYRFLQVLD
jgi:hypothetical protein